MAGTRRKGTPLFVLCANDRAKQERGEGRLAERCLHLLSSLWLRLHLRSSSAGNAETPTVRFVGEAHTCRPRASESASPALRQSLAWFESRTNTFQTTYMVRDAPPTEEGKFT